MCTVTWLRAENGFELFFNRDELLTRGEAVGPRVRETGEARFLAPTDADFGGSWISVNERGVALGILNGYRRGDEDASAKLTSRGLLLTDLAPSGDLDAVETRVRERDLRQYRSFRLVALEPAAPARVFEWDGSALTVDRDAEARIPLVSSSFDETDVGRARRAEYARLTNGRPPTEEDLIGYHGSHENGPSAYSVCMHRADASTRSFSRVVVGPRWVRLSVRPGPPCEGAPEEAASLPRR